jgi:ubiquinone/menaquinone biosynthesis C-methylase UbiE
MYFEKENKSWLKNFKNEYKYHLTQFNNPKQSTLRFYTFIKKNLLSSKKVVDIAAGACAATCFFASKATNTQFTALDINCKLLKIGKKFAKKNKISNIVFKKQDLYKLKSNFEYDGGGGGSFFITNTFLAK